LGGGKNNVNNGAALRVLMVVEAPADARTIATLIDKVLLESGFRPSWLEPEHLEYMREWVDLDEDTPLSGTCRHVIWTDMTKRGPRVLGHGTEGPTRNAYAKAARRAIVACELAATRPNSVVLVVDADAQGERTAGLIEARKSQTSTLRVVVGAADPKREAWVLNAFEAKSPEDTARLEQLRAELTLDPCFEPHRLRGKRGDPRDIKRILAMLVDGDADREMDVLREAPLDRLRERGVATGLTSFLNEADKLCECLDGPPGESGRGLPS
jgi:hypothetical protein